LKRPENGAFPFFPAAQTDIAPVDCAAETAAAPTGGGKPSKNREKLGKTDHLRLTAPFRSI
jgi:hypothetical protein